MFHNKLFPMSQFGQLRNSELIRYANYSFIKWHIYYADVNGSLPDKMCAILYNLGILQVKHSKFAHFIAKIQSKNTTNKICSW